MLHFWHYFLSEASIKFLILPPSPRGGGGGSKLSPCFSLLDFCLSSRDPLNASQFEYTCALILRAFSSTYGDRKESVMTSWRCRRRNNYLFYCHFSLAANPPSNCFTRSWFLALMMEKKRKFEPVHYVWAKHGNCMVVTNFLLHKAMVSFRRLVSYHMIYT